MSAAASLAKKSGRMRVVDHRERVVFFREIANRRQIRDRTIHRKTAVGGDQLKTRIFRRAQLRFEIRHVVVLVTEALRFAEPDTVDDTSMIQFITDHCILFSEQRFE